MINLVVILNGPPYCGKNYLADGVKHKLSERFYVIERQFKDGLFALVKEKYNQEIYEEFVNNQDNHEWKAAPQDYLNGRTPREELIHISEVETKPIHGKNYFARKLIDSFSEEDLSKDICLISDGGFKEEIQKLLDAKEIQHVLLVHVHSKNCSFKGDSRDYVLEDDLHPVDKNLTVVPFYNLKKGKQDIDNLSSIIKHVWSNDLVWK